MILIKPLVTMFLLIPYVCTMGALSFEAKFPDGAKVRFEGWMF